MPTQHPEFKIDLFDRALHDRSAFCCGVPQIDTWLQQSITDLIKANRLRLWCATDGAGQLAGFYALNAHSVEVSEAPALTRRKERHPIPAIYLQSIAVAEAHQGNGFGHALMGHALAKAADISRDIAAAAVILDVHRDAQFDRRLAFYQTLGFRALGDSPERLFLSIRDIEASRS